MLGSGFNKSQYYISIYYKYAPGGTKIIVLFYFNDCLYSYTSEYLGKWFLDSLGKIFRVNFLGCAHWFISINTSRMNDPSISVDQARYATSMVAKYLDTSIVKTSTEFYKTTFPYDMILTKAYESTGYEKVEKLTREFNIHYRACIVNLIYLLYTRVDSSFAIHK